VDLGLNGKTAIVCGASSGIGLAIARGLAEEGANIVMTARRADVLAREAEAISAVAHPTDLSEPDAPRRLVDTTVKAFGGIDVLVWNSGGPPTKSASEVVADDLTAGLQTLVLPLVRLVGACLPHLRASGAGRILAITSSGTREPLPNLAISNALRPGVTGYLKTLSKEVAAAGITVNCLAPGYIRTARTAQVFPGGPPPGLLDTVPAGRFGTAEEVANVGVFLMSERASYVTGATLSVDGGLARSLF
jgi:3-oxoacyl-[acyl-carrier protein] reductase